MKRCCGRRYSDNYNFCTKCGAKLEIDFWGELSTDKDEDAFELYSDERRLIC